MLKEEFVSRVGDMLEYLERYGGEFDTCKMEIAGIKYRPFLLEVFPDIPSMATINKHELGKYWCELDREEKIAIAFIRYLLVLQFKEHCLETELYKTF